MTVLDASLGTSPDNLYIDQIADVLKRRVVPGKAGRLNVPQYNGRFNWATLGILNSLMSELSISSPNSEGLRGTLIYSGATVEIIKGFGDK